MIKQFPILPLGDVFLSVVALYAGFSLRFTKVLALENDSPLKIHQLPAFTLVLLFSSFLVELYDYEKYKNKRDVLVKIVMGLIISFFFLSALYYLMPFVNVGRGGFALSLVVFGILQFMWHVGYKAFINSSGFVRRVLILGTGPLAQQIGRIVTATNHHHVLRGYLNCSSEAAYVPSHAIVGNGDFLLETVKKERAQKIVISLSERRGTLPVRDMLSCKLSGVEVVDANSFYEEMTGKLLLENIRPSCFIFSDGFRITSAERLLKRLFDVVFAVIGLFMSLPIMPFIALAVKVDSPGPLLFKQRRVGEWERPFVLYKFRTMRTDAESETGPVWTQKNDCRVTKIGNILRKFRLDEIPQIINVLKGDMSFIGPRPERPEFVGKLKEIIPYFSERHCVKPGITGWAQIKYSYGASVEDAIEKLKFDLFYVKNLSLYLDLLIIFETIKVVLFGRGGR